MPSALGGSLLAQHRAYTSDFANPRHPEVLRRISSSSTVRKRSFGVPRMTAVREGVTLPNVVTSQNVVVPAPSLMPSPTLAPASARGLPTAHRRPPPAPA